MFTERELDVLRLLAQGYMNKEIAGLLCVTDRTIQGHIANMFRKTGMVNRTQLVVLALDCGVISLQDTIERVRSMTWRINAQYDW